VIFKKRKKKLELKPTNYLQLEVIPFLTLPISTKSLQGIISEGGTLMKSQQWSRQNLKQTWEVVLLKNGSLLLKYAKEIRKTRILGEEQVR